MQNTKFLVTLVVILFISNMFFGWMYVSSRVQMRSLETKVENQKINGEVLLFTQLFMEKVLGGAKEVSFDDRLQLENSVRNLNDKEIFDSWQIFTKAKDAAEVQKDFYSLFELLLKKISI